MSASALESRLRAEQVSLAYGDRQVVSELSLAVPAGKVTVIVGANASGKSTVLRALSRLLRPTEGVVLLDGKSITSQPSRDVARALGLLPQSPVAPEGITVRDLVARGRHPHQSWWRQWGESDGLAVDEALRATGMLELADRDVDQLSGGQRQRAWIAMAVAQETDLLLLDEPTTYLDIAHQLDVLELVADLNREHGRTIVMVLHDLNLACRYADHIVAMRSGRLLVEGPPAEVVTADLLRDVFNVEGVIVTDEATGAPVVLPHRTIAG
ncbi:ABC transporter ATP-binding protein [Nocardioides sp. NPDC101246]|uniref:ABC transporter ATP-binding protein n=1 Tax=Nocardioides sp. NPDC101246 TaxID=3364336 RepID=UPI0038045E25